MPLAASRLLIAPWLPGLTPPRHHLGPGRSLSTLPAAVSTIIQVRVAQGRIQTFLDSAELASPVDNIRSASVAADGKGELIMESVSVQWEKEAARPNLSGLNIRARSGELVAIVGSVGSGKSTVLAAMLGEMHQTQGRVICKGRVGFCGQQPWLISGSLRENILYGSPYEHARYQNTIKACGLEPDLRQFQDGDQTTIGERGINISGATKPSSYVANIRSCVTCSLLESESPFPPTE
jgi:ABC-type bacteriocin/lantibiotic exporter with double-glycine peptidase domain